MSARGCPSCTRLSPRLLDFLSFMTLGLSHLSLCWRDGQPDSLVGMKSSGSGSRLPIPVLKCGCSKKAKLKEKRQSDRDYNEVLAPPETVLQDYKPFTDRPHTHTHTRLLNNQLFSLRAPLPSKPCSPLCSLASLLSAQHPLYS